MKPLYLILICVSCSWGQGTTTLEYFHKNDTIPSDPRGITYPVIRPGTTYWQDKTLNPIWKPANFDTVKPTQFNPQNFTITLQDLLDYEKECYADSLVWIIETPQGKEIRRHVFPSKSKEPTFQGFIEYLKKRRK